MKEQGPNDPKLVCKIRTWSNVLPTGGYIMKNKMKNKRFFMWSLAVFALTVLALTSASCGNSDNNNNHAYVAPADSTITISPSSRSDVASGVTKTSPCTNVSWDQQMFTITIFDSNNQPMNNIAMTINLDWANNTSTFKVMQLFDSDPNLGGLPTTVPYETKTDSSGTKTVFVRFDISCVWNGSLNVSAKSAFAKADIAVAAGQ